MACRPVEFSDTAKINIQGKSSFITAFGSTARREIDTNIHCLNSTNSYGPRDGIFQNCQSACHKDDTYRLNVLVDNKKQSDRFGNPSLADPLCSRFKKEKLDEALKIHNEKMGRPEFAEQGDNFLGWVKIKNKSTGEEVLCYPHKYNEGLKEAKNMWDFPYRHGWCKVCRNKDCMPSPGKDWGWCQPACNSPPQPNMHHEIAVDAFEYESCAKRIDTSSEFCAVPPIFSGYGQVFFFGSQNTLLDRSF